MKSLLTQLILGMLRDLVKQYLTINRIDALVDGGLDKFYDLIASLPFLDQFPEVLANIKVVIEELKAKPEIAENIVNAITSILGFAALSKQNQMQFESVTYPPELQSIESPLRELRADCCDEENCDH